MAYLLRQHKMPLPFCPGCGGHAVTRALDKALEQMGLPGRDVCIVTDIGCNGLMDQYFDTLAFHGLHGRSLTYAAGIKLAKPKLKVVVICGDGGTGIGGGHLLSAARRDVDITLVDLNNFNYGMTGGQHSATTPMEGITSTTALGNVEKPLDICGAVIAAGGRFAARKLSSDKDLADTIAQAVSFDGFSIVDVIAPCTAYFMPRNFLKKTRELEALCGSLGWDMGVLKNEPGDSFLRRYRAQARPKTQAYRILPPPATRGSLGIKGRTEVVLAASAGNRVRFAATAIAQTVIDADGHAVQKDDYPITVRSGYSVAHLVLDPNPIEYTGIDSPDVVVIASEDGLARVRPLLGSLTADALVLADEAIEKADTRASWESYPIRATAAQVDRNLSALVSAVLLSARTGIVPPADLRQTLETRGSKAIRESNLKAFDLAAKAFAAGS